MSAMGSNEPLERQVSNAMRDITMNCAVGTYIRRDAIANYFGSENDEVHPVCVLNVRYLLRTLGAVDANGCRTATTPLQITVKSPHFLASSAPAVFSGNQLLCLAAAICRVTLFHYNSPLERDNDIAFMEQQGWLTNWATNGREIKTANDLIARMKEASFGSR